MTPRVQRKRSYFWQLHGGIKSMADGAFDKQTF